MVIPQAICTKGILLSLYMEVHRIEREHMRMICQASLCAIAKACTSRTYQCATRLTSKSMHYLLHKVCRHSAHADGSVV